jgi:hypothetical protein
MRFLLLIAVAAVAAFAAAVLLYNDGMKELAEFLLRVLTGFGVLVAVVVAIYGDRIRDAANRIRLQIENTQQTDSSFNVVTGPEGPIHVFCHHLLVRNLTPSRTVKNCRVWLVKILDEDPQGAFREEFRFAVPRLMEWAPAEYSPDVRSFSEDQVFDFGQCHVDRGRFEVSVYKTQGGMFMGGCVTGKRRRYVLRITADNYVEAKPVTVQVKVKDVEETETWPHGTKAEVVVLA